MVGRRRGKGQALGLPGVPVLPGDSPRVLLVSLCSFHSTAPLRQISLFDSLKLKTTTSSPQRAPTSPQPPSASPPQSSTCALHQPPSPPTTQERDSPPPANLHHLPLEHDLLPVHKQGAILLRPSVARTEDPSRAGEVPSVLLFSWFRSRLGRRGGRGGDGGEGARCGIRFVP